MHCVNCGAGVPDGAAFCPSCGKPAAASFGPSDVSTKVELSQEAAPKKKNKLLGCLAIGFGVLVLLGIIGAVADPQHDSTSENASSVDSTAAKSDAVSNDTETAVAEADLPLAVKASELFNAFQGNEASAQRYFGERTLFVTGIVEKVSLDFMDDAVVELRTPNQFMSVQASLADNAQDAASNYNPGDTATLLCQDVSEVASIPMLKDCRPAPANTKTQPIEWAK